VDGAQEIAFSGICLNGRGRRAKRGLYVRAGSQIEIDGCRFGDFGEAAGAAIFVSGESQERSVREVVIQKCHFVNGAVAIRLERDTTDHLVVDNRFDEICGPIALVDPMDDWSDYGLIFVKNRAKATRTNRQAPHILILPGAEGIRLAENTLEGSGDSKPSDVDLTPAVEVRGGGPLSTRRLEILLNRIMGNPGPGISASHCGPGFVVAGNRVVECGSDSASAVGLFSCHGVLVEDNEIVGAKGSGIHAHDCTNSCLNGNEVLGNPDSAQVRGGSFGLLVDGKKTRHLRLTDNRISGVRNQGLRVTSSRGVRIVGNEVQDCGAGIQISSATNLLLVGNDCRDNGGSGIQVDREVCRGLVALNYAILNESQDLEIHGDRIRCHSNKVDRVGVLPEGDRTEWGRGGP
jgi:parallel beta-helix repeat protein